MKPYVPETLPLESLKWEEFIPLIGKANFELARYEGILQGIINPSVFLSPLTTQEAVLSSKIEGTEATLKEILEYEAAPRPDAEKLEVIQEIINVPILLTPKIISLLINPPNLVFSFLLFMVFFSKFI